MEIGTMESGVMISKKVKVQWSTVMEISIQETG
jgi:hypothetical protein